MKKTEIARRWARQSGMSEAEAADQLDRAVSEILARVRQNGQAPLPGLGIFRRAPDGTLWFEHQGGTRRA